MVGVDGSRTADHAAGLACRQRVRLERRPVVVVGEAEVATGPGEVPDMPCAALTAGLLAVLSSLLCRCRRRSRPAPLPDRIGQSPCVPRRSGRRPSRRGPSTARRPRNRNAAAMR
ncbi:hypothetical protein AB0H89_29565 [Catellatospora methionotrophica]